MKAGKSWTRAILTTLTAIAVVALPTAAAASVTVERAAPRAAAATANLHRLYSPGAGDHFYTTSWSEAQNAFNNLGYKYEGVAAQVWTGGGQGRVALHRLYSPGTGDHFYTTSWNEAQNAFNNLGYKYEGIAAYVLPA